MRDNSNDEKSSNKHPINCVSSGKTQAQARLEKIIQETRAKRKRDETPFDSNQSGHQISDKRSRKSQESNAGAQSSSEKLILSRKKNVPSKEGSPQKQNKTINASKNKKSSTNLITSHRNNVLGASTSSSIYSHKTQNINEKLQYDDKTRMIRKTGKSISQKTRSNKSNPPQKNTESQITATSTNKNSNNVYSNLSKNLLKRKYVDNLESNLYKMMQTTVAETSIKNVKQGNLQIPDSSDLEPKNNFNQKAKEYCHPLDISLNNDNSFVEGMEWEETPEEIALELQTVRNTLDAGDLVEIMDWQDSPLVINKQPDCSITYFVVDTNIFISSLKLVTAIQQSNIQENVIVIPWQVLKELDCLKSSTSTNLASCARKAVQYLLTCMTQHSSNVVWQTQQQASQECPEFTIEIPDDHIIMCCFQLNLSGHNVVLISNDKNLRLKASVYKIMTFDDKILESSHFNENQKKEKLVLEEAPAGSSELDVYAYKLTTIFKTFLNNVVKQYLISIYGNMWVWKVPEKPPLSLRSLLELLNKLARDILKHVETKNYLNLLNLFFTNKNYNTITVIELDNIARKCLSFAKLFIFNNEYTSHVFQFENDMYFLKSAVPNPFEPYNELCCKLTITHFQKFERILVGYCYKAAEILEINIADSIISDRQCVVPNIFKIKLILGYLKVSKLMKNNLERLSKIDPNRIDSKLREIVSVYDILKNYVKDRHFFFTIEDVVEFLKNNSIRQDLPGAVNVFDGIINILEVAKNTAVTKKLL